MKTSIVIFAAIAAAGPLLGAAANVASIQQAAARRQQALQQARNAVVDQKLGLSPDQKTQTRTIRSDAAAAIKAVRADASLTADQKQTQVQDLTKKSREAWRSLLTAQQITLLAEINRHPAALDALARQRVQSAEVRKELGLTAEQNKALQQVRVSATAAAKAVRADQSLSAAQKTAEINKVNEAARRDLRAALTPDERTKLNQVRQRLLAPLGPLAL